ncbi:MAG: hypothetical protein WA159_09485 [Variovorax sp.]
MKHRADGGGAMDGRTTEAASAPDGPDPADSRPRAGKDLDNDRRGQTWLAEQLNALRQAEDEGRRVA